jgi:hypothetical protein
MTAQVQLKKKYLGVGLIRLDAKTNWVTVSRQL